MLVTNKIQQVIESAVGFGVRQALKAIGDMPMREVTAFLNGDQGESAPAARVSKKVAPHASKEETRTSKPAVSETPKATKKAAKKAKAKGPVAAKPSPKVAKKAAAKPSKTVAKKASKPALVQRRLTEAEVNEQVEAAKVLLAKEGKLTRGLVMEKLGASPSTTNVVLKRLVKAGFTKQTGTKRNTVYKPTPKALGTQTAAAPAKKGPKAAKAAKPAKTTKAKAAPKKVAKVAKAAPKKAAVKTVKAAKSKAPRSTAPLAEQAPSAGEGEEGITLEDMFEDQPTSERRPSAPEGDESSFVSEIEPEPQGTEVVLDEAEAKTG